MMIRSKRVSKAGRSFASVIIDKMTGRSRGFGFVEMEDADAEKAVKCSMVRL